MKRCQSFVASCLPSRKDGGAPRAIQGGAGALSIVENIGLPGRGSRSPGHGEDTVHQACLNHMARVRPLGSDGKEVPVNLVYDQVAVAAKYSQQDCKLDSLLDSIEEEVFESK